MAVSRLLMGSMGLALLTASALQGAEWGTIKGRFVYDGKAPQPKAEDTTKDPVCTMHKVYDERLVVGEDGGLANVLVALTTKNPAIHSDYEKTAKDEVVLDNHNCHFEPHIRLLRTTQTLVVKNSDPTGHNTKLDMRVNPPQNLTIPQGTSQKFNFTAEEGIPPCPVGCNIHPWMKGYVVVRSNPYMAVTDDKGNFTIENVPAGKELQFKAWHELGGYMRNAKFKGGKTDAKGFFTIKVKPGENDLGEIKMPAGLFAK